MWCGLDSQPLGVAVASCLFFMKDPCRPPTLAQVVRCDTGYHTTRLWNLLQTAYLCIPEFIGFDIFWNQMESCLTLDAWGWGMGSIEFPLGIKASSCS